MDAMPRTGDADRIREHVVQLAVAARAQGVRTLRVHVDDVLAAVALVEKVDPVNAVVQCLATAKTCEAAGLAFLQSTGHRRSAIFTYRLM